MAASHSGSVPSFNVTFVTMVIMAPSITDDGFIYVRRRIARLSRNYRVVRIGSACDSRVAFVESTLRRTSMALEILHRALMLLCRHARGEGPEIPALPGSRILFPRVEAITSGWEFSDHLDPPWCLERRYA